MEVGSIIEMTEAKKIRYEAKYLGPWVGCGGEVDVPCGVKFCVVEVDGDECRCLCLDESIVEMAKRLEIEKVLKRAAGERLAKKFLGVSFFVLELGYFDARCCCVGLAPTRSGRGSGKKKLAPTRSGRGSGKKKLAPTRSGRGSGKKKLASTRSGRGSG